MCKISDSEQQSTNCNGQTTETEDRYAPPGGPVTGSASNQQHKYVYNGSKCPQWYSGTAVSFGAFCVGCVWSWSSTALPSLKSSGSLGEISPSLESWITSVVFLGGCISCMLAGFAIEKFGLRTNMLVQTPPLVISWILVTFAWDIWVLLLGRFLTGFFACGLAVSIPAFVAEATEVSLRGKLGFGYDIMGSLGISYIFFIGTYVTPDWRWQAASCGIGSALLLVLLVFVPESPLCLLRRGKSEEEAYEALCWFRGCSNASQECTADKLMVNVELADMIKSVENVKLKSQMKKGKSWTSEYLNSQTLKPTLIGVLLMVFYELTGMIAVFAYTVEIFRAAGSEDEKLGTLIVGLVQLWVTVFAAFFVDRLGRKALLIASELLTALPLVILGVYVYLKEQGPEYADFVQEFKWIPVVTLVFYSAAFGIGMAPIVWVITGELVPPSAKGFSSGIITISNRGFAFLVVLFFNDLIRLLGQAGAYWFFACCCIIGAIYIGIYVPETKGKTLNEISEQFDKRRKLSLMKASQSETADFEDVEFDDC